MATYDVTTAKHATLTPNVVDAVTCQNPTQFIMVFNQNVSGNAIYLRVGDPKIGVPNPTIAGDDSYYVGVGQTILLPADGTSQLVKLISSSAQEYSVMSL